MRIADLLAQARAMGVDRLDGQWLLTHLLGRPRSWLLAHDDERLDDEQITWVQTRLARRANGEPLAYLVGEREFCGLALQVTPDVLIPRPETELLVDWAGACLAEAPSADIADLGTGSGAVALALKHRHPQARVRASDLSTAALDVARGNGQRLQLDVEWLAGDWWGAHAAQRYGLVVSNPPYIVGNDPHLAALGHEPLDALTPRGDSEGRGLLSLRQIVHGAPAHLLPGAWLLLEHGHDQGAAVIEMLRQHGFAEVQTRLDLAGLARCTGGRLEPR